MTDGIHVFVYDGLLEADDADDAAHTTMREATVQGTLFDVEGLGPALLLSGHDRVPGVVRRVPPAALEKLDARARVREGVYRRVGVQVGATPCWTWVAGPALAPKLVPDRRVRSIREEVA